MKTVQDLEKIYPKNILERFPIAGKNTFHDVPDEKWFDWKWQLQNRINNLGGLQKVINLTDGERDAFEKSVEKFKMSITPYFGSLMNRTDSDCPI